MELEDRDYWKSLINMSLTRTLILQSLYHEPSHGYAILEKLARSTEGCCTPTFGCIYPVLKQLVRGRCARVQVDTVGGRKRRVYELTVKGQRAYLAAAEAWKLALPHIQNVVESSHTEGAKA